MENITNFATTAKALATCWSKENELESKSKNFRELYKDYERVNFIYQELEKHMLLPTIVQDGIKCEQRSITLRQRGNTFFGQNDFKQAWRLYCQSIACAPTDSGQIAIGYANRSAILFRLGNHEDCLRNIELAIAHHYPENLSEKLEKRKLACNRGVSWRQGWKKDKIPTAIPNALRVTTNEIFGRHMVAGCDVNPGDVLAVEEPHYTLIWNENCYIHCHHCLRLSYALIPCTQCTLAWYCTSHCREIAYENYHRFECHILLTLSALSADKYIRFALRIALIEQTKRRATAKNDSNATVPDYNQVRNLISNRAKRSVDDLFNRVVNVALVIHLLHLSSTVVSDDENSLKNEMVLLMMVGPSNFHDICELQLDINGYDGTMDDFACAVYPQFSLLNHSCAPNVTRVYFGAKAVIVAIDNVRAGEQCFDNYGYHFALHSKQLRTDHLRTQYYFDCKCVACVNAWPMLEEMPNIGSQSNKQITSFDCSTEIEKIQQNIRWASERIRTWRGIRACREFCAVQEYLKHCWYHMGNKRMDPL